MYQFTHLYPLSFEFSEHYLVFLAEHIFSNKYGNFLYITRQLKKVPFDIIKVKRPSISCIEMRMHLAEHKAEDVNWQTSIFLTTVITQKAYVQEATLQKVPSAHPLNRQLPHILPQLFLHRPQRVEYIWVEESQLSLEGYQTVEWVLFEKGVLCGTGKGTGAVL